MGMLVVDMLEWWYDAGLKRRIYDTEQHMRGILDYFSIGLLLRTLFSPFRQISAGQVSGPPGVQMRAFFDRLISRLIGALVRLFMVLMGVAALVLYGLLNLVLLALWIISPVLPLVGAVLFVIDWVPWGLG